MEGSNHRDRHDCRVQDVFARHGRRHQVTTLAATGLLLLAFQATLVAMVSALRPKANVYVTIVVVSVATAPLFLVYSTFHIGQLGPDGQLYLVLIHLALGGFLFHFMTLPDRSVTLRILVE